MNHFLLIPDGDRRYAEQKNISNLEAYKVAAKTLRNIIKIVFIDYGVKEFSFFGLSYSNVVKRNENDLNPILKVQAEALNDFAQDNFFQDNSIKINVCGEKHFLPKDYLEAILKCEANTNGNQSKVLNLLLGYSGTKDYEQAIQQTLTQKKTLTHENIVKNCFVNTHIDFMLRTAGEQRISDGPFFLTQYTEYSTVKTFFPALTKMDIDQSFNDFKNRKRTFGI